MSSKDTTPGVIFVEAQTPVGNQRNKGPSLRFSERKIPPGGTTFLSGFRRMWGMGGGNDSKGTDQRSLQYIDSDSATYNAMGAFGKEVGEVLQE